jgi:hypothetical protein
VFYIFLWSWELGSVREVGWSAKFPVFAVCVRVALGRLPWALESTEEGGRAGERPEDAVG